MTTLRDESGVVLNPGDEVLAVGVSSRWMSSLCHDWLTSPGKTQMFERFFVDCFRKRSIRIS